MTCPMDPIDRAQAGTANEKAPPASPERAAGKGNPAAGWEPRQEAAERPPRLKVVVNQDGGWEAKLDHPDRDIGRALLMRSIGTNDRDFWGGILRQLGDVASDGKQPSETKLNFMLAVMQGIQPRDQVEAMLAAQMAAVQMATMRSAARFNYPNNMLVQADSAERAFNKLTRAFIAQMDALKRYRTGGEQKVTVQHVTVTEGGQAIVGNVTQPAARSAKNRTKSSPKGQSKVRRRHPWPPLRQTWRAPQF